VRSNNETYQQDERDERMCFLPLCHIAERVLGAYTALSCGTKLNFVENPETVPENVREIAPTVFGAVPRIWEKFYSGVLIGLKQAGALPQWAYSAAIAIGYRQAKLREEGKSVPAALRLAFWLARLLVLNNVRKAIGVHRARLLITGAAPISPDLVRWYMALGLEMIEVWGQTESCGIGTNNLSGRTKPGSIGLPAHGTEVKVSPEGEFLVRGSRARILGRVCMDQCVVAVVGTLGVCQDDEVVLIGRQNGAEITADELAARCDTVAYEVVCGIGSRVPRLYFQGGRLVAVDNGVTLHPPPDPAS